MASSEDTCDGNPDFAVICSFITKFGDDCGVNITIPDLQQMLEDTKNVHEDLSELHIHLLRRGRKRVTKEKWEKSLIKFCHEYSSVDAWELERFGYKKSKLSVKLELLKRLLELQFDSNPKFKAEINKHDAQSLRIPPVGRDIDGQCYWYQLDKDYNFRLYRQGVGEESSWQLLCSTTDHMKSLLASLEKFNTDHEKPKESSDASKDVEEIKMESSVDELKAHISESKPCSIIIKTEKKDSSSRLKENAKKDSQFVRKSDKIPENKAPEPKEPDKKSSEKLDDKMDTSVVVIKEEVNLNLEESPMEIDCKTTTSSSNDMSKADIEVVDDKVPKSSDSQTLSVLKEDSAETNLSAKPLSLRDEPPTVSEPLPSEMECRSNKLKMYEKWSNEKLQASASKLVETPKQNTNSSGISHENQISSLDLSPEKISVDSKQSHESALNKSKSPQDSLVKQGPIREDAPMDLSVSFRSSDPPSVISVETSPSLDLSTGKKKRPLSDSEMTSHNGGNQHQSSFDSPKNTHSEAPRPFKKKHLSMAMEEARQDSSQDHARKSVIFEVKNNKLFNPDSVKDQPLPSSGFSHLQALQNMCNDNPMTCFQGSVIHPAGQERKLNSDGNLSFPKYSPHEKSAYSEGACDNLSKMYKFNYAQLSGDVKPTTPESGSPSLLLKSNVCSAKGSAPKIDSTPKTVHSIASLVANTDSCKERNSVGGFPKAALHVSEPFIKSGSDISPKDQCSIMSPIKDPKFKDPKETLDLCKQDSAYKMSVAELPDVKMQKKSPEKGNHSIDKIIDKTSSKKYPNPSVDVKSNETYSKISSSSSFSETSNKGLIASDGSHNFHSAIPSLDSQASISSEFQEHSLDLRGVIKVSNKELKDEMSESVQNNLLSPQKDSQTHDLSHNESPVKNACDNSVPVLKTGDSMQKDSEVTKSFDLGVDNLSKNKGKQESIDSNLSMDKRIPTPELKDSSNTSSSSVKSDLAKEIISKAPSDTLTKIGGTDESKHSNKEQISEPQILSDDSTKFKKQDTSLESKQAIKSSSEELKCAGRDSKRIDESEKIEELTVEHDTSAISKETESSLKSRISSTKMVDLEKNSTMEQNVDNKTQIFSSGELKDTVSLKVTNTESLVTDIKEASEKMDVEDKFLLKTEKMSSVTDKPAILESDQKGEENCDKQVETCELTSKCSEDNVDPKKSEKIKASSESPIQQDQVLPTKEILKESKTEIMEVDNSKHGVNEDTPSEDIHLSTMKKGPEEVVKCRSTLEPIPIAKNEDSLEKNVLGSENLETKKQKTNESSVCEVKEAMATNLCSSDELKHESKEAISEKSKVDVSKDSDSSTCSTKEHVSQKDTVMEVDNMISDESKPSLPDSKVDVARETIKELEPEIAMEIENKPDNSLKTTKKEHDKANEISPKSDFDANCVKVDKTEGCNKQSKDGYEKSLKITKHKSEEYQESSPLKVISKDDIESGENISKDESKSKVSPKDDSKSVEAISKDVSKDASKPVETVSKDVSECMESVSKDVSKIVDTVSKDDSKSAVAVSKDDSKSAESVSKDDSKPSEAVSKDDSKSAESVSKDDSKPSEAVSKDDSKSAEAVSKDDSKSDESVPKEDSKPAEPVSKDISKPVETVSKDMSEPAETILKGNSKSVESFSNNSPDLMKSISNADIKSEVSVSKDSSKPKIDVSKDSSKRKIDVSKDVSKSKGTILSDDCNSDGIVSKDNSKNAESVLKKNSKPKESASKIDSVSDKNDVELNKTVTKDADKSEKEASKDKDSLNNKNEMDSETSKTKNLSSELPDIDKKSTEDPIQKKHSKEKTVKVCKAPENEEEPMEVEMKDPSELIEKMEVETNVSEDAKEQGDSLSKEETVKDKMESDASLTTPLKSKIEDSLEIYSYMRGICHETKFNHLALFKPKPVASPSEVSPSKPNLITSFSMDVTEDMDIIHAGALLSPLKKKRGRLRKDPQPMPPKANARQSKAAGPKKPETDSFTIPEGFLEILEGEGGGKKDPPPRKSRGRKKLTISTPSVHSSESESAPIKRSSRIQAQQKKKMSELAVEMEKEQRMLELLAKKSSSAAKKGTAAKTPPAKGKGAKGSKAAKSNFEPPTPEETCMETKRNPRKMNSRSRTITKMTLMYEDESKDSEFSTSRETEKSKRGRRRGRGSGKKGHKPWDVSSESESSIEEITEEEEEEEEPDEPLVFEENEDEFACEEVDEDAEPIIVRRARTAKKVRDGSTAEEPVVNDDKPCRNCGKYDQPEWILLCDKCDNGYHTHCLKPPLTLIPDGDWYCQPCEHMFLCEWLQKEVHDLELVIKQREREELRKQRLAYVGISLDNVLKPEKKEKSDASSNEEDSEEEEVESKGRSRESSDDERTKKIYGKRSVRARRTVNYQFKEYDALIASAIQDEIGIDEVKLTEDEEHVEDKEEEEDKPFKAKLPRTRKKTKRLNDLDFSDEDIDSGDEYKGSSSNSEQTAPPSGSESAGSGESGEWKVAKSKGKGKSKSRKGRRGRSSDEDWEEENESDSCRPTTRRAARKAVSYRELSSDEEWSEKPKKAVKKRKKETSSEESDASFKKKKPKQTKRKSRVRKWASSDSSEESEQSMSFSGDDSSQKSEDEWRVKKSSGVSSRLKVNINKKVLSSEEEEEEEEEDEKENEESSRESKKAKKPAPKKKVVSEEEEESEEDEEEEGDEEDEESEDEEEEEEEESEEDTESKPVEKPKVKTVEKPAPPKPTPVEKAKPTPKPEAEKPPKVAEQPKVVEKTEPKPPVVPPIPDLAKIKAAPAAAPVPEKAPSLPPAPARTVKKDTTKMVPCVIPYDKSPKTGLPANPEEDGEKERARVKESGVLRAAPKPFGKAPPPKPYSPHLTARPAPVDRRPFKSTIIQPFSNIDDDGIESDDEVPLERIPTHVVPTPPAPTRRESEYIPAAKGFSYTAPEEKCFPPPPTYSPLASFQDYGSRPSPLKPSLVETYSNSSSPSKLTPLDSYSQTSSPKGFISLDSYSESRKMKKQHFYGNQPTDHPDIHPSRDTYHPQGGEIRFPPEPYPCTSSPGTYRTPPPPGTPPRLYSQYQDSYAPPRSPDYYQNHQYYSDDRVPRTSGYQPNYVPPEPSFVTNPYVATPVPQPNGGFMIDTLLRARNPENEEDELTEVTDIVSYITQE